MLDQLNSLFPAKHRDIIKTLLVDAYWLRFPELSRFLDKSAGPTTKVIAILQDLSQLIIETFWRVTIRP